MNSCIDCRNYYLLMYHSIENANEILDNTLPDSTLASEIENFVFANSKESKTIPMWIKAVSAAAAIIFGVFIGDNTYEFKLQTNKAEENTVISQFNEQETLYMAETTEIIYRSFINESEDYEK